MTADFYPLQVVLLALSGWANREQQRTIEYLVEENRVLKEQLKGRMLRRGDDQRRRLAAKGKRLGRRLLNRVATIVTPDTIMRWHCKLIAAKWTFPQQRAGRRGRAGSGTVSGGVRRRYPWAELPKRVFAVDVLRCHRCGGRHNLQ